MPENSPGPTPRAQYLVERLQLQPHPEGGWYREVFRSTALVQPDGRPARHALTSIYFLLEADQHSRWHKVRSDEVWVHLEGETLDLWSWDADSKRAWCTPLGPVNAEVAPQHVIAADLWQAARPRGSGQFGFTLLACMVAPGFDFSDFQMMDSDGDEARHIQKDHPDLALFI